MLEHLLDTIPFGVLRNSFLLDQALPAFWSTHFSGVGTVEQAAQCLVAAGRKVFPKAFQLTFRWACESQPGCRQALDHALGGGACILHDILARCPVATEMFTRYKAQKIIDGKNS